jgi:hypothetical protein
MDSHTMVEGSNLIRSVFFFFVLLILSACTGSSHTITGTVVDESGTPLSQATVTACYLGWAWSKQQLVWDKRYCSDPYQTDHSGTYTIVFRGPAHMTLHATKHNWLQIQDFNSTNSQIVLSSNERRNAQFRAQQQKIESEFRTRQPGESEADYYCRVITQRSHSNSLTYRGETLSFTQTVMQFGLDGDLLFALSGSREAVDAFVEEVEFLVSGEPSGGIFQLRPTAPMCDVNTHIVQASAQDGAAITDHVKLLLPSIHAGWDMEIWNY